MACNKNEWHHITEKKQFAWMTTLLQNSVSDVTCIYLYTRFQTEHYISS